MHAASPFERAQARCGAGRAQHRDDARDGFAEQPREWRPLVYCWRGGQRSRALDACAERDRLARACSSTAVTARYRRTRRRAPRSCRHGIASGRGLRLDRLRARASCSGRWPTQARKRSISERIAQHRGSLLGRRPGHVPALAEKVRNRSRSPHLASSTPASGLRRGRKPARSARSSCPMRCSSECTMARRSSCARRCRNASRCSSPEVRVTSCRARRCCSTACARWSNFTARRHLLVGKRSPRAATGIALIGELLESHYDPLYGRSMARHFPAAGPSAAFAVARCLARRALPRWPRDVLAASDDSRTAVMER